ncbi:barrier-to-autointegration factor-like protein [Tubulanus polymorphus]|uniref:barrier-to-autointegration factor-like protein n=1 Tax=Tubulanus polymorphus TaxID=672921 RepID=UPI003DA4ABAA
MSNTTAKYKDFLKEPMGNKPVTAVPGIGPVAGERLRNQEIEYASQMVGQYLRVRNDTEFTGWVKDTCGTGTGPANACTDGIKGYSENFM